MEIHDDNDDDDDVANLKGCAKFVCTYIYGCMYTFAFIPFLPAILVFNFGESRRNDPCSFVCNPVM